VIRSLLFIVVMVVSLIPYAIVLLLVSFFVRGRPLYNVAVGWLHVVIGTARWIGGVQYRVTGLENVPTAESNQPVILCPKHQSTWETFALPTIMPHPLAFVFKQELLRIPFFGWCIGRLDMVHIDRSKRAEAWNKVAEQGVHLMEKGVWIIMFPEGTRSERGGQGAYKTGATRLAVTTGAQIVPIAVSSGKCWPRRSFVLRPGRIDVSIGKPIDPAGREPDELMREIEVWIEAEMRRIDPQAYAPGS
jgi:1-acyl-sn-glycerol-3-phosphate acyltransferase